MLTTLLTRSYQASVRVRRPCEPPILPRVQDSPWHICQRHPRYLCIVTSAEIARVSPSFGVLARRLNGGIDLDRLHWREFEELLADLLTRDGYSVELGPGTKDGGKDLVAIKDMGELGLFASVWQAKKLTRGRKVQEHVLRELADTRDEMKAGKGVIATTTYLTRGALKRVTRDRYILGKVDRARRSACLDRETTFVDHIGNASVRNCLTTASNTLL